MLWLFLKWLLAFWIVITILTLLIFIASYRDGRND
jgi:hypothetical protein